MTVLPDISDNPWVARHLSPDGRLVLDMLTDFDPRDVHEMREQSRPRVYDAATGAVVIDLWQINCSARFDWPAEGGLVLRGDRGIAIRIDAEGTGWSTDATADEPALAFPAGAGGRRLSRLVDQNPRNPVYVGIMGVRPRDRVLDLAALLLFGTVVAWLAWAGWHGQFGARFLRRDADAPAGITGWLLRCPEPIGFQNMYLKDGRMSVQANLARAPLPRLPGDAMRFGDGHVTVTIAGTGATIARDGQAVRCKGAGE